MSSDSASELLHLRIECDSANLKTAPCHDSPIAPISDGTWMNALHFGPYSVGPQFFKVGHLNKFDVNYLKDPYNWALSHLWGTDPNGRATGLPSLCAAFGFWAAYLATFLPQGEVMIDTW